MPYSEFVRSILTASGDERKNPATVWYKELERPENFVDDVGQVFLGQRLACANCHHHPYEKWSQDDYWGLASFFGRVARKNLIVPGAVNDGSGRGPSLVGVFGSQVKLEDGSMVTADETYLRESILTPQMKTVSGYQQLMPTFQGLVNEQSVASLIEYIKTMQSGPAAPPVVAAQAP